ncbi:hypothetical protein RYX36_030932 [Vicia faba]
MGAAQVQNGVAASSSAPNQATAPATATTATHGVASAASSSDLNQATAPATTMAAREKACEVSKTPKKKICCACPDTKRIRDECIVEHGEDACGKWIEAHRLCLRSEGFNV